MLDLIWVIQSSKFHQWRYYRVIYLSVARQQSMYELWKHYFYTVYLKSDCLLISSLLYLLVQKRVETEFSALLNAAEGTCGLLFSYDANLTLRYNILLHLRHNIIIITCMLQLLILGHIIYLFHKYSNYYVI